MGAASRVLHDHVAPLRPIGQQPVMLDQLLVERRFPTLMEAV
jgi:hypothetical protein